MFSDPSQEDGEKGRSGAWWEGRDSWRNKNPWGKEFADSHGLRFMFLEPLLEHHHLGKKWGSQENVLASSGRSSRDPGYVKMSGGCDFLCVLPPSGQALFPSHIILDRACVTTQVIDEEHRASQRKSLTFNQGQVQIQVFWFSVFSMTPDMIKMMLFFLEA